MRYRISSMNRAPCHHACRSQTRNSFASCSGRGSWIPDHDSYRRDRKCCWMDSNHSCTRSHRCRACECSGRQDSYAKDAKSTLQLHDPAKTFWLLTRMRGPTIRSQEQRVEASHGSVAVVDRTLIHWPRVKENSAQRPIVRRGACLGYAATSASYDTRWDGPIPHLFGKP